LPQIVLLHQKPQNTMWRRVRYWVVFIFEVLNRLGDQLKQLVLFRLEAAYELGNRSTSLNVMLSNPGSRSIWIVSSFVTQRADLRPEYLACLLCAQLALFIKETERRDDA